VLEVEEGEREVLSKMWETGYVDGGGRSVKTTSSCGTFAIII
jgi:hypothetical protein